MSSINILVYSIKKTEPYNQITNTIKERKIIIWSIC